MEIIIDGYNLIGNDTGLTGNLERKRHALVQQLRSYHKNKGHGVTVIFDGWQSGSIDEVEQKRDGITIVYSRLGEKADNVIIRRTRKESSRCVVVTSDREVRNAVERLGAVALYASEFRDMLSSDAQPYAYDDEELDEPRKMPKKGNPNRLSKKERRRREKLNKLKS